MGGRERLDVMMTMMVTTMMMHTLSLKWIVSLGKCAGGVSVGCGVLSLRHGKHTASFFFFSGGGK